MSPCLEQLCKASKDAAATSSLFSGATNNQRHLKGFVDLGGFAVLFSCDDCANEKFKQKQLLRDSKINICVN